MKSIFTTPPGSGDMLFEQCFFKRKIEGLFAKAYQQRGYSEVVTPLLEYYEVFSACDSPLVSESMYKLIDKAGRICVLRPDSTIPIGRVSAVRLKNTPLPVKLFYTQNVFRSDEDYGGRRSEITQSGVEVIGATGKKADIDVIVTAFEALDAAGVKDYKLEIGHVNFYKSVSARIPFQGEDQELVRYYTDRKNYAAIGDILARYEKEYPLACETLRKLPSLFGGREVFEEAAAYMSDENTSETLRYVKNIYGELCSLGLEDRILLDFGLVHHLNYYTGIVFRGYAGGQGASLLTGGRYDALHASFGSPNPAIGFAIDVDEAVKLSGILDGEGLPAASVLVFYAEGQTEKAYSMLASLQKKGVSCEISLFDTLDESVAYAKGKKITAVAALQSDGLTMIETGESV